VQCLARLLLFFRLSILETPHVDQFCLLPSFLLRDPEGLFSSCFFCPCKCRFNCTPFCDRTTLQTRFFPWNSLTIKRSSLPPRPFLCVPKPVPPVTSHLSFFLVASSRRVWLRPRFPFIFDLAGAGIGYHFLFFPRKRYWQSCFFLSYSIALLPTCLRGWPFFPHLYTAERAILFSSFPLLGVGRITAPGALWTQTGQSAAVLPLFFDCGTAVNMGNFPLSPSFPSVLLRELLFHWDHSQAPDFFV